MAGFDTCSQCGSRTTFRAGATRARVYLGVCGACYAELAREWRTGEPRTMYPRMTEADHDRGHTGPFARVVEFEEEMREYGLEGG